MLPTLAAGQPMYSLVELDPLYGATFNPVSIGDDGSILGNKGGMACIAEHGRLRFLPQFAGRNWYAVARSNGRVLGYDQGTYQARLYENGQVVDIGINGSYNSPSVYDINNAGRVTGKIPPASPFVWQEGNLKLLPSLIQPSLERFPILARSSDS